MRGLRAWGDPDLRGRATDGRSTQPPRHDCSRPADAQGIALRRRRAACRVGAARRVRHTDRRASPGRLTHRPSVGVIGRVAELERLSAAVNRATTTGRRRSWSCRERQGSARRRSSPRPLDGRSTMAPTCCSAIARRTSLGRTSCSPKRSAISSPTLPKRCSTARRPARLRADLGRSRHWRDASPTCHRRRRPMPTSERYLLFAAVVGLSGRRVEAHLIVLVLDDLQWADKGSLQLLRHVVAAEQRLRVMVLGTYRDSELSRDPSVPRDAGGVASPTRCQPRSSSRASRRRCARADGSDRRLRTRGHRRRARTRRSTPRRTATRSSSVSCSHTSPSPAPSHGTRTVAGSVPSTSTSSVCPTAFCRHRRPRLVGSAIRRRERCPFRGRHGRDFDLELLAEATNGSELDLLEVLDEAKATSLVNELTDGPGKYQFSHALIQHALYQGLGPTRQAATHRAVAVALEALTGSSGARVNELARHWGLTGRTSDASKAIEYGRLAGDAALKSLAPADALGHFERVAARLDQLTDSLRSPRGRHRDRARDCPAADR